MDLDAALLAVASHMTPTGPQGVFLTREWTGDVVVSLVNVAAGAKSEVPYARINLQTGQLIRLA